MWDEHLRAAGVALSGHIRHTAVVDNVRLLTFTQLVDVRRIGLEDFPIEREQLV
jgi:hypothetical protein